jgi:ABC-2 type transport system ATP-binding protein
VATDSVQNLQARARGGETVVVEVAGRAGGLDPTLVQRALGQVPGVSAVALKDRRDSHAVFQVQSSKDRVVRGDLARAVVSGGWDLNELRPAAVSLEEIFLQLTGSEDTGSAKQAAAKGAK